MLTAFWFVIVFHYFYFILKLIFSINRRKFNQNLTGLKGKRWPVNIKTLKKHNCLTFARQFEIH